MLSIIKAEWKILRYRRIAWIYLILSLIFSALTVGILQEVSPTLEQTKDGPLPLDLDFENFLQWSLVVRNALLLPMLLMFCVAQSITEEKNTGMLQETFLLPISRTKLLTGKILCLLSLSSLSLLLTLIPNLSVSFALWNELDMLLCYGINIGTDLFLISLTILLGTFARSAGTTAIYLSIFFAVEGILRLLMYSSPLLFPNLAEYQPIMDSISKWLPSVVLESWKVWELNWSWGSLFSLALCSSISLGLLKWRYERMEL